MRSTARRVSALPKSGIREIMNLAYGQQDVIHLEVGDPSFDTPSHIVDAACEAAHNGWTRYTPNQGYPSLRSLLAERYSLLWNTTLSSEQVLVTAGGVNALTAIMLAIADPEDEILVPDPGFPNYLSVVALTEAKTVPYPLKAENAFLPVAAEIEPLISERSKAIVFNSPSNPTGTVFPADTFKPLLDLASAHDLFVVSDEIYEEHVFDGIEHIPAARFDSDGRVITVSGCSKTFAMTGWRLGYAIADERTIAAAGSFMEPLVSCAPSISQRAAEAAFTGPRDCIEEMRLAYQGRRDIARSILEPAGILPIVPQGAFYALVDLQHKGITSDAMARELLANYRVAVAPGSTFGAQGEGHVRISLAASDDDVAEGCRRIVSYAQQSSRNS